MSNKFLSHDTTSSPKEKHRWGGRGGTLLPNQERNALRVGWIGLAITSLATVYGLFILGRSADLAHYAFLVAYVIGWVGSLAGILLTRRGRVDGGMLFLVGCTYLVYLILGAFQRGGGVNLALFCLLVTTMIAALSVSRGYLVGLVLSSALVSMTVLIFDLYVLADWRQPALIPVVGYLLIGVFIFFAGFLITQFRSFNLPAKLIIAFLSVSLVSLGAVSALTNYVTQEELKTAAGDALLAASIQTAARLDDFFRNNLNTIRTEAQNPDLVTYLCQRGIERSNGEGMQIAENDVIKGCSENEIEGETTSDEEVLVVLRTYARKDQTFISSYALLNPTGMIAIDTYTADIGKSRADREYFRRPLEDGLPFASAIEFSPTTGDASLYFSAPVRNAGGEVIGILRCRYDAAILQEIVFHSNDLAGSGSYATLLDEYYVRLADGSMPENIFKSVTPLDEAKIVTLQEEGRLPLKDSAELSTNLSDFQAGLDNASQEAVFSTAQNNVQQSRAVGAVRLLQVQPWYLVFLQPEDAFLGAARGLERMITMLFVVVAALGAGAAYWVSRALTRPITNLTAAAQQISAGNLGVQALAESGDEIGMLAGAFNTMTTQLKTTIGTLEQRVDERTRALQTSAEVSRRLSTILDEQTLLNEVVGQVQGAFGYYHVHIYLVEEGRGEGALRLLLAAATGEAGKVMLGSGHFISRGQGLVGRAAETHQPVLIADIHKDVYWLPNPLLPETRSELAIPILIGEAVLGVLDVQHNQVGGLTNTDVDLLQTVANQTAAALQNARAYQRAQRQAESETQVAAINQQIQGTTRIEDALQVAARELGRALKMDVQVRVKPGKVGSGGQWAVGSVSDGATEEVVR